MSEDIARENKYGADKNAISWRDEDGVLISVSEAEFILNLLKALEDGE